MLALAFPRPLSDQIVVQDSQQSLFFTFNTRHFLFGQGVRSMCLSLASRRSCLYFAWPVCGVFFPQDFLNIALKVFQSPEVEIPSFLRVARGAGRRPTVSRPRITPSNHVVTSCAYVGACPLIMLRCQYMVSYNEAATAALKTM